MPDDQDPPRTPHIPKPPTPKEVDQISREQELITDEWAQPEPDAPPGTAKH